MRLFKGEMLKCLTVITSIHRLILSVFPVKNSNQPMEITSLPYLEFCWRPEQHQFTSGAKVLHVTFCAKISCYLGQKQFKFVAVFDINGSIDYCQQVVLKTHCQIHSSIDYNCVTLL